MAKLADAKATAASKFKLASLDAGGDGGGGGGYVPSARAETNFVFDMGRKTSAAPKVSGMTKNFGGERIGVAGDDIFQMITRQYRSQDNADGFFRH